MIYKLNKKLNILVIGALMKHIVFMKKFGIESLENKK